MPKKSAREGRTITVYVTDQEWALLVAKIKEQGQEGSERQTVMFAKQWAKAGVRMPIREELERRLFQPNIKKQNGNEKEGS